MNSSGRPGIDPILCEIVKNGLMVAAQEAGMRTALSAGSTFVAQSADVACTFFDAEMRLITQTDYAVLHSAALRYMLREMLQDHPPETLVEGDILISNDPFRGGIHPTDVAAIRPVFHEGKPAFYCGLMMIVSDLGGVSAGGLPATATECFHEGMIIPPSKLFSAGKIDDQLSRLIAANSRTPRKVASDIGALAAGGNAAAARLGEMIAQYGFERLMAMIDELLDYSERLTRAGLSAIPDGVYRGEYTVEQDGVVADKLYPVKAEVTVADSNLRVDFAGTAPQARGAINCTSSQSVGCVTYAVRCQLDPTIPMNEGFYRPIEMLFPPGSVVNCTYPAACNLRLGVGQAIIDSIIRALAPVSPDCAMAAAATVHTVNAQGMTEDGGMWGMLEVSMGAGGGRRGADGGDGLPFLMHGQSGWERNIEGYEWQYPIRIHRYQLMPDTAGPGRWRGGCGLIKDMEFLGDALITLRATDRCERPPEGLDGGLPGSSGGWVLNEGRPDERKLPNKVTNYPVKKGDVLTIRVPGSGGYGDPAERDPEAIARDMAEGLITSWPYVVRPLKVANDG